MNNIVMALALSVWAMQASAQPDIKNLSVVIEWAPFKKLIHVADQQLIAAADALNFEFLARQQGFIKRELVKKSASEYADIIHWQSQADAERAGLKVASCAVCLSYFELMDGQAGESGAGFSYYATLKQWHRLQPNNPALSDKARKVLSTLQAPRSL